MTPRSVTMTVLFVLAACGRSGPRDDQATGTIDSAAWNQARNLPPGVREALDSGNAAFRARNLDAAREQYLRAVQLGPKESAAWFGLSMVERQLGNVAAADSAMRRVQELTPEASLIESREDGPPDSTSVHR